MAAAIPNTYRESPRGLRITRWNSEEKRVGDGARCCMRESKQEQDARRLRGVFDWLRRSRFAVSLARRDPWLPALARTGNEALARSLRKLGTLPNF